MERILHRVNSPARLRAGVEAGFDRLELDVHHRAGRFVVSHDPPFGPFTVGLVGVEFPTGRRRLLRRHGAFLELGTVLETKPPPLYVDLKGPWTERALRTLLAALRAHGRDRDVLGSGWPAHATRIARVDPQRGFVLGVNARNRALLWRCVRRGVRGVSLPAGLVERNGRGLVRRLQDAGVAVYVWDVPDRGRLAALEQLGVAGAIVDDPAWFV